MLTLMTLTDPWEEVEDDKNLFLAPCNLVQFKKDPTGVMHLQKPLSEQCPTHPLFAVSPHAVPPPVLQACLIEI